jgi:hypothetical protein
MRVKKRTPYEIRGYLLLPRRGGSIESWTRVHPDEVTYVGNLAWPEAQFGFHQYDHVFNRPEIQTTYWDKDDADARDYWSRKSTPPRKRPAREDAEDADNSRIDRSGDP